MKHKSNIFLSLILFSLIFSNFFINTISVSNVNYVFNRNILLDSDTTTFNQEFNLRDVSALLGHYNATYGFLNDTVGGNPLGWTINEAGGTINIFDTLNGHRQLVELHDTSSSTVVSMTNLFNQVSGTIEFWIRLSSTDKSTVDIKPTALTGILITFENGHIYAWNNVAYVQILANYIVDKWYHFRIDFECSGNGYLGLPEDRFDIYIDGILKANNFQFLSASTPNEMNILKFQTVNAPINYFVYVDAVGYSWNNYNIGFNLVPILESTPFRKEVDKSEFALKNPNVFTTSTDIKLDGFQVVETSDGLVVPIVDTNDINDRILSMSVQDGGDLAEIVRSNIGITGITFIHTSFTAIVQLFDGIGGGTFENKIRSSDNSHVGGFKFDIRNANSFNIDVWISGWTTIAFGMDILDIMLIDHYIDYNLDIQIVDITINGVFQNRTIKPLAILDKSGFNKIEVGLFSSAVAGSVQLDSLGIYTNGVPFTEGLGWSVISIGKDWNFRDFNLFTKKINGFIHIGSTEGFYQVEHFPDTFETIANFKQYNNISEFSNIYNTSGFGAISNSSFVFTVNGSQFSVSEFLIEGVILKQQSNEYNLRMTFDNISINDNFFFVDNNHRLRFNLTVNENNSTEFMEAIFIINDFSTDNLGISFTSQIENKASGLFIVEHSDSVQNIPLSILSSTQRNQLTISETTEQFSILITDNNNNNLTSSTTSGFVSNIIIYPTTDILDNTLIFNLLTMLIPLIIILLPTIALRELYGSIAVLPIFLLMSIVLFFGGIIPVWLMFIILISTSLFMLKKRERIRE